MHAIRKPTALTICTSQQTTEAPRAFGCQSSGGSSRKNTRNSILTLRPSAQPSSASRGTKEKPLHERGVSRSIGRFRGQVPHLWTACSQPEHKQFPGADPSGARFQTSGRLQARSRSSLNSRHAATASACRFRANGDRGIATKSIAIRRRVQAAGFRSWSIFRLGHRPDLRHQQTY